MNRRSFLQNTAFSLSAISSASFSACAIKDKRTKPEQMNHPQISLAQWSMHRALLAGTIIAEDFARIARSDYGIYAIEYVNQFYVNHGSDEKFWISMRQRAEDYNVKSLLIMVDDEGDLGVSNDNERKISVENHYKWVHAAQLMGCHSIRVNAFGDLVKQSFRSAIVDGMGRLAEYAGKEKINVIIENHGLFSSNADFIVSIIKEVDMENFGTFPDFGNWCLNEKWGSTQGGRCTNSYDAYLGVQEFLPFAKAVSAKSYDFDENGKETSMDYYKLLKIVKDSGYQGYVGVEYEGERLSEPEGIIATKNLIEKVWKEI